VNVLSPNLYISIDKDALSPTYAATNWDQGSLTLDALKNFITTLTAGRKILGIDICGERAHDFEGDEHHTVQEADKLNSELNRELVEFLQKIRLLK
jgi:arginase family enzyme